VDTSDTRVVVLFAGNSGNPRDAYEKETLGALQLSEVGRSARLLGEVPNSQIHRLYAAADISVLPSLKEATSITGLESMASGVPLIGTNVGGIPDLIEHEHDGLLVERGDPRGLAQAVGWLARHPHARADFAQRARQKAVSSFSWNEIARRTIEVYHKASQFAATSSGRLERTL